MFIGIHKISKQRVYIDEAISERKKSEYVCPICGGELIIKNGNINTPHYAHKSLAECDTFSADMSKWHRDWQNVFPKKNQEVILELKVSNLQYEVAGRIHHFSDKSYNEFLEYKKNTPRKMISIKHRADVLACGYVIEFQHSPISSKEFNERNWFYTELGYKVIWIFDFIEDYTDNKMSCTDGWNTKKDNGASCIIQV